MSFTLDSRIDEAAACEELVARLREAVKLRLISEVPLGAFLSGGVDSSAVVTMMAGLSGEPVNTCSISFSDPAFDESKYAEMVADAIAPGISSTASRATTSTSSTCWRDCTTSPMPTALRFRRTACASSPART